MTRGKPGAIEHSYTVAFRIDPNLAERYRLVCRDEETSISADLREFVTSRVNGHYEDIGSMSAIIAKAESPRERGIPATGVADMQ